MRYCLIKAGKVANVIEADAAFAAALTGYDAVLTHDRAGPGWLFDGATFTAPVEAAVPVVRVLSRTDFLRLFTLAERTAIRAARRTDAVVDDFMYMLEVSAQVRMDHADTVAGVNYMETSGKIAAGRAAKILAGVA